ncbi:MAG: agmatinase, partial [Actinobacteria bacterium]|nr:agmatinase [Actinomycetota bacterium]
MSVKLLGVPYDVHSSFLRGSAAAPQAVRDALTGGSANWCTESGLDLEPLRDEWWCDLGDLVIPDDA